MTHQSIPPALSGRDQPLSGLDELEEPFRESEKPPSRFRIGAEAEKFGFLSESLTPVRYSGERSILSVFERLREKHGWRPVSEFDGAPVIALSRGQASITLEPGAQLELSGAPLDDVHQIAAEFEQHYSELAGISDELGLTWLSLGFQPLASEAELPWVPKERYGIMKRYLPERGSRGRDMMQRTATVQANLDYESEEDAMRKLRVLLRLSVIVQATCANSPFFEGVVSPLASQRADVWLHMDPARSGLISSLWGLDRPRYRDYVEWALDAGMFFFKRGDQLLANTGQTFRSFLEDGFEGHRPTRADWFRHLATLFPEVRLKSTLEVRASDALPRDLTVAVPALLTGLVYDSRALDEAEELADTLSLDSVVESRPDVARRGLAAEIGGRPVRELAERLLDSAKQGLSRRARLDAEGRDEVRYLEPLSQLVESGRSPGDELRGGLEVGQPVPFEQLRRALVAGAPPPTR